MTRHSPSDTFRYHLFRPSEALYAWVPTFPCQGFIHFQIVAHSQTQVFRYHVLSQSRSVLGTRGVDALTALQDGLDVIGIEALLVGTAADVELLVRLGLLEHPLVHGTIMRDLCGDKT